MIARVIIDQALVTAFRKMAQAAYPDEAMVTMWGRIESDSVVISRLRGVEQDSTDTSVQARVEDMVAPAADHLHERYLGTMHSHPDLFDASPSEQDWQDSWNGGEFVFGVLGIVPTSKGRFRTNLQFWPVLQPIDIIHPRRTWTKKVNDKNLQDMSGRDTEAQTLLRAVPPGTEATVESNQPT